MLLGEWNQEEAIEVAREEGEEIGMEKGREEAREEIFNLFEQGLSIDEIKGRLKR